MIKKLCVLVVIGSFALTMSGCAALLTTALSAAASYGIYMATKD